MLIRRLFTAALLALAAFGAFAQDKVVYHFECRDAGPQGRNIRTTSTSTGCRRSPPWPAGRRLPDEDAKDRSGPTRWPCGSWWRAA